MRRRRPTSTTIGEKASKRRSSVPETPESPRRSIIGLIKKDGRLPGLDPDDNSRSRQIANRLQAIISPRLTPTEDDFPALSFDDDREDG
jgi:hypothetical protein